jgi:hypothetical protein
MGLLRLPLRSKASLTPRRSPVLSMARWPSRKKKTKAKYGAPSPEKRVRPKAAALLFSSRTTRSISGYQPTNISSRSRYGFRRPTLLLCAGVQTIRGIAYGRVIASQDDTAPI